MDKNYYFVMEPDGTDDGPYVLSEIRRRLGLGLVSPQASLCRVGETEYLPLHHDRYAAQLAPPRRPAMGTREVPVVIDIEIPPEPPPSDSLPAQTAYALPPSDSMMLPSESLPAKTAYALPPVETRAASFAPTLAAPSAPQYAMPEAAFRPAKTAYALPPIETRAAPAAVPRVEPTHAVPHAEPSRAMSPSTVETRSGRPPQAAAANPATPSYALPAAADPATPSYALPPIGPAHAPPADSMQMPPSYALPLAPEASAPFALPLPAPPPEAEAMPHDFVPPPPRATPAPQQLALQMRPPQPPAVAAPKRKLPRTLVAALAGGGAAIVVGGIAMLAIRGGASKPAVKDAMVRVTTPSGTGAGFLIDGPDELTYVVTAYHVVDRGERVLIERDVGTDKHAYVEAFPETEIVASDADADLAIIRIKNVAASRFDRLPLAKEPQKDARILSYGYPGSNLAKHAGLVSKDGKILSLVSFPAYDERYARVLRDNAVDGLLISTDIEPGMSGGPTLNDDGEVVGVNVTKDRAHVGQNGAVSVTALAALVKTVKPASERTEPKPEDVVALLKKVQTEYLLLPLEERSKVRETEFVSRGDLPNLRQLVGEVRRQERNTDNGFIAKFRLSGQAALGIFFARLPGKLLETYRAPSTTTPLLTCELANQHLTSFLGDLGTADKRGTDRLTADFASCDDLAVRPLAWDLVAATLQWDGKEKEYAVTKLDKIDDEGKVYRASVRISGAPNLIEIWIGVDQQAARLKLFDPTNNLYAIKSPRTTSTAALQGTWSMKRPRVTDAINKDAEIESTDTLSVSIGDDRKVSLRYVINERYFSAGSRGKQFKCNHKATIDTGLLQSFTGTIENGVIVALPEKDAEPIGADSLYCSPGHRADRIVAAKLAGDQLVLYRTDGSAYPETIQLAKE